MLFKPAIPGYLKTMSEPPHKGEMSFRGIPVSAGVVGVVRGLILVLDRARPSIGQRQLGEQEVPEEINRLERALVQTRQQLLEVQRKVSAGMGAEEGGIFDAHLLVLEDRTLLDEVVRMITEQKVNAEHAFHSVAERYAATLAAIEDDYLRERATDMRDVTTRVLNNLLGLQDEIDLRHLKEPCIIISHDLTPSNTAQLDKRHVLGFATDVGSKTSHTAIMARSLRIPAVVGLKDVSSRLESGQYALLDGINGVLIINPTDQTLFEYGELIRKQVSLQEMLRDTQLKPAVTLDRHRVFLSANIEQPGDAEQVKANGADGVGLFRTEYLFINRERPPNEEQQYQAYREAAVALKPLPVVIRTLDLGGDKFMAHMSTPQEMNPFLGLRAIRLCLAKPELFKPQLRAVLRAGARGHLRLMFPMVATVAEVRAGRRVLEECRAELAAEGAAIAEKLEVGIMVEIPAAAVMADQLAAEVDFFSIGTNDLSQYTLAADRTSSSVSSLADAFQPSVLRLVRQVVQAAHREGKWAGMCGEIAGEPLATPLLLGLGLDELSMNPTVIPQVKQILRGLSLEETQRMAPALLDMEGPEAVRDWLAKNYPV